MLTILSPEDLDSVRDFFDRFRAIESETWAFLLQEDLGRMDVIRQKIKINEFFEGKAQDFVESLQRARRPDAAWFEKNRAIVVGPRTVFALQVGNIEGVQMALVYSENFKKDMVGMRSRFVVADVDGALKIVARQVRCGDCDGEGCGVCGRQGWRRAGGRRLQKPKKLGELRKLVVPTDLTSKGVFDALG